MLAFIDDVFISFISNHNQVLLNRKTSNFFNFGSREYHAGRIRRTVEIDRARFFSDVAMEGLAETFAARFFGRHQHDPSLTMRNQILNRRPVRRKHENFITGIYD